MRAANLMTVMPMTVSIVVTCFNLERYIGSAIDSALGQRHSPPIEIIVVDDCSTDSSAEIIRSFGEVRYLRTARNAGVLLAMLDGIEAASGDIILLLDGDDLWAPDKLSAVAERFFEDSTLALVTHDLRFVDQSGHSLPRRSRPDEILNSLAPDAAEAKVREGILTMGDFVWLGSALAFRRSLTRFDEFAAWARSLPDPANTYQDWPLAFWVASNAEARLGYIGRKLLSYRIHDANHSGDARTARRASRNFMRSYNTVEAMIDIARQRNLPGELVKPLEQRAVSYCYLAQLQSGERLSALRGFARAWPDFARRGLIGKELLRLAGVQILGPDRFAALAGGRRIMPTARTS
jgi:glycosyltransferase involved in cell wall biosynthesis